MADETAEFSTYGDPFFDGMFENLGALFSNLVEDIKEALVWFVNSLIQSLGITADAAVSLMPDLSEFCGDCLIAPDIASSGDRYISTGIFGFARWVLPIDAMVCLVAILVTTTLMYFTIMPVLRWLKVVR